MSPRSRLVSNCRKFWLREHLIVQCTNMMSEMILMRGIEICTALWQSSETCTPSFMIGCWMLASACTFEYISDKTSPMDTKN